MDEYTTNILISAIFCGLLAWFGHRRWRRNFEDIRRETAEGHKKKSSDVGDMARTSED